MKTAGIVLWVAVAANIWQAPARADEKGDALLKQVRTTVHALAPLVGEYTVTFHAKTGDKTAHYQAIVTRSGTSWRGYQELPLSVFNLFDPITQVPATTRYLGRRSVDGEMFDVVELKQPMLTFQLYLGSDGLIHRAHTVMGTPLYAIPVIPPIDPKTGMPTKTPEQVMKSRIIPPTQTDTNEIEIVVTDYHKLRASPARLDLPPPVHAFDFPGEEGTPKRRPFRIGLSPNGTRMAVNFTDGSAQIVAAASGTPQVSLNAKFAAPVLVFSPDGKRLATADNTRLTLWEADTGHKQIDLTGASRTVVPIFSPNGKLLAGMEFDHAVLLWDAVTGKSLPALKQEGIEWAQFSADGAQIVTMRRQESNWFLTHWDAAAGKLIRETAFPGKWQWTFAVSPDGKWLVLGREEGGLSVFDARTGVKARDLPAKLAGIQALKFASDGKTLIAVDMDTQGDAPTHQLGVTTWDTTTWQAAGPYSLPPGVFNDGVCPLQIAPDGKSLVSSDLSRGIRIWTLPVNKE